MGFGVCGKCGGYWCSVGGYVNYCVCKPAGQGPASATLVAVALPSAPHRFVRDNQDLCHECALPEDAAIHGAVA